ncbi:hypothetical protein BDP27DRAFT_1368616 [Rhodocollybia butyracea]|uniref:Uncharacterized protein n=1 Tax=Rhodocollybia butyracea TaxID=206335 RepID=A0A9P5U1Q8_9AGAR|nr:hypothetical protein BDP27DRAFT_1368616 [Rhodocollybia butyracea]
MCQHVSWRAARVGSTSGSTPAALTNPAGSSSRGAASIWSSASAMVYEKYGELAIRMSFCSWGRPILEVNFDDDVAELRYEFGSDSRFIKRCEHLAIGTSRLTRCFGYQDRIKKNLELACAMWAADKALNTWLPEAEWYWIIRIVPSKAWPLCSVQLRNNDGDGKPVSHFYESQGRPLVQELDAKIIPTNGLVPKPAFQPLAPRLYAEYEHVNGVLSQKIRIRPNFAAGSFFLGAGFNFGSNVWTFKHQDKTRSTGRLVAATILLSPAVITRSNTIVHPDDQRSSFTRSSAGAVFRWVENGCRTEVNFAEKDPE